MSYKPTVMPKQDPKPVDNLGAAGLQYPQNPESIKAFSEVRNVDAKKLNADLQSLDEKRSSATPGLQIPSDAQNIKEFKEVSTQDAASLNAKLQN